MKFNDMAILYVNSHHSDFKYVAEANKSAASFKQYLPNTLTQHTKIAKQKEHSRTFFNFS